MTATGGTPRQMVLCGPRLAMSNYVRIRTDENLRAAGPRVPKRPNAGVSKKN
jgi:hypothetical protein